MKAVIAEAIEGVGAFFDIVREAANFVFKFSTKVISTNKALFSGNNPPKDN